MATSVSYTLVPIPLQLLNMCITWKHFLGLDFIYLFIYLFKIIFIDYAITVVPFPPLHSTPSCPPPPSYIPPPIVHVHGSYI